MTMIATAHFDLSTAPKIAFHAKQEAARLSSVEADLVRFTAELLEQTAQDAYEQASTLTSLRDRSVLERRMAEARAKAARCVESLQSLLA